MTTRMMGILKRIQATTRKRQGKTTGATPRMLFADFKVTHGVCAIFMIISHSDWVSSAIAVDPIPFFLTISISQKASQPEIPGLRIFSAWLYSIFFHFLITIQMRRFVIRSNRWDVKKVWPGLSFFFRHSAFYVSSSSLLAKKFSVELPICIFCEINDWKN